MASAVQGRETAGAGHVQVQQEEPGRAGAVYAGMQGRYIRHALDAARQAAVAEQRGQSVAKEGVVVGDHAAHRAGLSWVIVCLP